MIAIVPLFILICAIVAGIATMLVMRRKPAGQPYPTCYRCDYNLVETIGQATRCPECGAEFANHGIRPPVTDAPRKHRMVIAGVVAGILLLASGGVGMALVMAGRARVAQLQAITARQQALQQQQAQQQQQQQAQASAVERDGTQDGKTDSAAEPDDQ